LLQHVGRNCCHFFPDVLFQIHCCPWFLFVHLALEISSEEEVLRLGTLIPMNIEGPTKYLLSQDRIIVFEIRLHSESPMLYRPALHGNWNGLSLARRALKDKFPAPTVPLTTVSQNRQVFLPDLVLIFKANVEACVMWHNWICRYCSFCYEISSLYYCWGCCRHSLMRAVDRQQNGTSRGLPINFLYKCATLERDNCFYVYIVLSFLWKGDYLCCWYSV
jgi:hypothetical protein